MHITVLYGGMSRYDLAQTPPRPFAGAPGKLFQHRTIDLNPEHTFDIRVVGTPDMHRPFYPATRFLALGRDALRLIQPQDYDLNKNRGYILTYQNRPAISTFHPIDCWDFKAFDDALEDEEDEKEDAKDVGSTSRGNFLHWAIHDYRKLLQLPWPLPPQLTTHKEIAPSMQRVLQWLAELSDYCVIDIETRRQDHSLDCIGFRSKGVTISVPIYRHTNIPYYSPVETAKFWLALVRLFLRKDIVIVGHNLAFDLSVLAVNYHLPLPYRMYDTMLAMHREFPQLEKSLSHALPVYTLATRNHKADIAVNVSLTNFNRLLSYNGDDVYWTEQIYFEQLRRAASRPNLADAVRVSNDTLRATLMISVTGTRIDNAERERQVQLHFRKAQQYIRICRILTGIADFNPSSPKQVSEYFYDTLKYPCEERTESGARASGTKALYKLQLKQDNPLIPMIVAAREASKAASSLQFRLKVSDR